MTITRQRVHVAYAISERNSGFQAKLMPLEIFQIELWRGADRRVAGDLQRPGGAEITLLANRGKQRRTEVQRSSRQLIDAIALIFAEIADFSSKKDIAP